MVDLLVLQTALNAIDAACVYILVALGFGLIYSTTRFFHFAHGAVVAWAAYFCYGLQKHFDLGFLSASIGAICLATCLGCMIEVAVYGPLRRRDVTPLVLMLASLGIYTVLQNILSLVFGDDLKGLRLAGSRDSISVWGQATLTKLSTIAKGFPPSPVNSASGGRMTGR
jgi:branched-chain amino acid transport system permease protein